MLTSILSVFAPLQIMEDYISIGHNHIFWNHPRSHFCVALLLYCTGYYICLGLVVKVSTPLSQAYLALFHFFFPLLPLSLLLSKCNWLCSTLVLCTLLSCYWEKKHWMHGPASIPDTLLLFLNSPPKKTLGSLAVFSLH